MIYVKRTEEIERTFFENFETENSELPFLDYVTRIKHYRSWNFFLQVEDEFLDVTKPNFLLLSYIFCYFIPVALIQPEEYLLSISK